MVTLRQLYNDIVNMRTHFCIYSSIGSRASGFKQEHFRPHSFVGPTVERVKRSALDGTIRDLRCHGGTSQNQSVSVTCAVMVLSEKTCGGGSSWQHVYGTDAEAAAGLFKLYAWVSHDEIARSGA